MYCTGKEQGHQELFKQQAVPGSSKIIVVNFLTSSTQKAHRYFSLSATEAADPLDSCHIDLAVQPFQTLAQAALRLKGWSEEALWNVQVFNKPVCPRAAASDIKAATENSARFQDTEGFAICCLFVGEGVKTIKGEDKIKALVFKGQCTYVPLTESNVFDPDSFRSLLCCGHHVCRVVKTGDVRLWQVTIDRHCQHTRAYRNLQKLPAEIHRYAGERLLEILQVLFPVHVPYQTADCLARQGGICHHTIVKARVSTGQPVRTFDLVFSCHVFTP